VCGARDAPADHPARVCHAMGRDLHGAAALSARCVAPADRAV
jgi:hypothetical protein